MRQLAALALAVLAMVGCAQEGPEVPLGADGEPDPVLSLGREIYNSRCVQCHKGDGSGGRGTALNDGKVVAAFPDIQDNIDIVAQGKDNMPAFEAVLSDEELEAVVRYTREVL